MISIYLLPDSSRPYGLRERVKSAKATGPIMG